MALRYADYGYILENGRIVMDGAADEPARERGREGVLPGRRAAATARASATSRATSAASGGWHERPRRSQRDSTQSGQHHAAGRLRVPGMNAAMTDHYDALEVRDPAEREQDVLAALPGQVAQAQTGTAAFAKILHGVDAADITSRAALAAAAGDAQVASCWRCRRPAAPSDPFGGFAAHRARAARCRACSPVPGRSTNPRATARDYWRTPGRCSRPAFAPASWCTTASATT